jgi:prepilin-type N-terminal cleavage/methylation domain-containing protein
MLLVSKINKKIKSGFTLIELMITIGIATAIMAVVLVENSKFNNSILLTNASYEVALTVRQAQVFGLSSRSNTSGTFSAYGVKASVDNPTVVQLFADVDNDSTYDNGEEVTGGVALGRGLQINKICYKEGGAMQCNGNPRNEVTVIFKRPNPEALIFNANGNQPNNLSYVSIILGPKDDAVNVRCAVIYRSGQISVKSGSADCEN